MSDNTINSENFSDEIRGAVNEYMSGEGLSPELYEPVTQKYSSIDQLPDSIRRDLPPQAQEIYLAAFNQAYLLYDKPEDRYDENSRLATCHAIAWDAVKKGYTRVSQGNWVTGQAPKASRR